MAFGTQIDDLLDTLGSATSEEVETALQKYSMRDIVGVLVQRFLDTEAEANSGSSSPPVTYIGTDPAVDQVTITAAPDQDGTTYLLRFEDSDGNLIGGFDWGGTVDAIEGFRAGSLDPAEPSAAFANGQLTFSASAFQAALRIITLVGGGDIFRIDPSATANGLVQIDTQSNDQIGIVVNSFGGTADFLQYNGPPDFNGEFRVTSGGGIVFPSADPHVVGAWWDNAGTLTRSAG